MSVFLLELLTEEIPARMQARAADELGRLFSGRHGGARVACRRETLSSPRAVWR